MTRSAGAWLPRGHVARPRLVDLLVGSRAGVVLGGSGWGKTTLSLELAAAVECRTAVVRLGPGSGDLASLRAALRRACRRAGLSACTAALDSTTGAGPALDALVDALAADPAPVLVIIDEIEHADGEVVEALAVLAGDLPPPHRTLLVGRALPPTLGVALDGTPTATLSSADLAFTPAETVALAAGAGIDLPVADAAALVEETGGWAAALTVALERLRLGAGPPGADGRPVVLGELVRGLLAALDPRSADAVVQLAHLVPLPRGAVDGVTGQAGLVELALRSGIPLDLRRDGWLDLSGPVREALVAVAPVDRECARRAAALHRELGEPLQGTRLLLGARDADGAAATLAALTPAQVARIDFHELHSIVAAVGHAAEAHPRALLHLARACEAAAEARVRADALGRAERAAGGDPALEREIVAERARDLVRDGHTEEAARLAEGLLEAAGPDELQTRVRALHVLGRTHAWRGDEASLAAAEPLLLEAAQLYLALGDPNGAAHTLLGLAYDVHTLGGRVDDAVDCLERAAALLPPRARLRAVLLDFHGEALVDIGRDDEAEVALLEADRLGRMLGDTRAVAYSAWVRARVAARRGDAATTRALLAAAEESRGDWFAHHTGVEFLAEAAVLLDQVGLAEAAAEMLGRARQRREEAPRYVLLAEGMIAARSGDPVLAEELLSEALDRPDLESRVRWRAALLRAWAAHRAGDATRAESLARRAVSLAAALGHPELLALWEPAIAGSLSPLQRPAAAPATVVVRVRALGTLVVERGGAPLDLPPGRPRSVVALLAASGGRVAADQAIEGLWPGVDPASGRKRLRNVLNRLRESAGEVVVRDGGALALAAGAEIDAASFEEAAGRALADDGPEAVGRARAALARYTGDLLPDERYEDWAAAPRERLRSLALKLVDRLAAEAGRDGELDDALSFLERGIELDGLDESRYLRAAEVLIAQGRRGRALDVLRRSAGALRQLGLEPSDEHRALVRAARG